MPILIVVGSGSSCRAFTLFFVPTNVHVHQSHGRVVYVDQAYAVEHNLTYSSHNHFILRADDTAVLDPEGPGRPSVRLISKKQYGPHVTVADIRHMPEGCG